jgi:hypothetical protein
VPVPVYYDSFQRILLGFGRFERPVVFGFYQKDTLFIAVLDGKFSISTRLGTLANKKTQYRLGGGGA